MSKNTLYKLVKTANPFGFGGAGDQWYLNRLQERGVQTGNLTNLTSVNDRTAARRTAVTNGTMTPLLKAVADKKDAEHTQLVDNLSKKVAPWIAGGLAAALTALTLPVTWPAVWTGLKMAAPHIAKVYNGAKKITNIGTIIHGASQVPGIVGLGILLATGRQFLPTWWKAANLMNGGIFLRQVQRFSPIEPADIDLLRQYKGVSSYLLMHRVVPGETDLARKKRLLIANRLQRALATAGYPQYLITGNLALGRKFNPDRWFDSEGNLLGLHYYDYIRLMNNGRKILLLQHKQKSPDTLYVPNDANLWNAGVESFYGTMSEKYPSSLYIRQQSANTSLYAYNHPKAAKFGAANAIAGNIATTISGLNYSLGERFSPTWWKTLGLTLAGAGGILLYDKIMDSRHRSQALKTYTPTINILKNQLLHNLTSLKTLLYKINDGNLSPEEHKKSLQEYQQAKAIVQRLQYQLAAVLALAAGNYTNNRSLTLFPRVPIPGVRGLLAALQAGLTQHGNIASFRHQDKVDYNPTIPLYQGGKFGVDPNTGTIRFRPSTTWNAGVLSRLYDTGTPWWQRLSHAVLQLNSPFILLPAAGISTLWPNWPISKLINRIYSNPYIEALSDTNDAIISKLSN